MKEFLC